MVEKAKDRLEVLEKIKDYENKGIFDADVENDPPASTILQPNQVDYKRKKLINKIKRFITYKVIRKKVKELNKQKLFCIKEINGLDYFKKVKTGAIITCNHFNACDSFAMDIAFSAAKLKHKKLFRVIKESNFTNPPPQYKAMMLNCNTLPLSENSETLKKFMQSVKELLEEGNFILIYPEQSMWWNYRKPKPLKNGAFKLAARNNVPILPIFITMEDSDIIGEDGFPVQEYIINIEKPIYPNKSLSEKENTEIMKERNYQIWKKIYEDFYKVPLEYTCDKDVLENIS